MKKTALLILLVGCVARQTPVAAPTPKTNQALVFEQLMEKYGVLPRSVCVDWENTDTIHSVVCEVNKEMAIYCLAASGHKPTCELAIDLRPPQPQKKDEAPATPTPPAEQPKTIKKH